MIFIYNLESRQKWKFYVVIRPIRKYRNIILIPVESSYGGLPTRSWPMYWF